MWVVETESGVKPVIARGALAELLTKTRQDEEQDDDTLFMLETITKTYHRTESDDELLWAKPILELLSKTDTISERDDPGSANFILELLTKTHVELESDDTGLRWVWIRAFTKTEGGLCKCSLPVSGAQ